MIPESLIQLDQQATLWLNSLHCPLTDNIWIFISDVRIWFPAYAFTVYMMFRKCGWKQALLFTLALIISVAAADQTANLVKNSVMRLRPCYTAEMLEEGLWWPLPRPGFYGFFSAHSSNSFAFASLSSMAFRHRGYTAGVFIWAALVALSRVFLAMHYLGDILTGMLLGMALGFAMGWIVRFLSRKFSGKEA